MEEINTPTQGGRTNIFLLTLLTASLLFASCNRSVEKETQKLENMMQENKEVSEQHNRQVNLRKSGNHEETLRIAMNASGERDWKGDEEIKKQLNRVIKAQKQEAKQERRHGRRNKKNYDEYSNPNQYDWRNEQFN